MSTTTEKLGLLKPELEDAADITAMNTNWDKIDDEITKPNGWTSGVIAPFDDNELESEIESIFREMNYGTIKHIEILTVDMGQSIIYGLPGFLTIKKYTDGYGVTNCGYVTIEVCNGGETSFTITRLINNNRLIDEWKWTNPPFIPGVEYRTNEFWWGQSVYTKVIDCGYLPNNGNKTIQHDINLKNIVRIGGTMNEGGTLPHNHSENDYIRVGADKNGIYIYTPSDYSTRVGYVQLWYTKGV